MGGSRIWRLDYDFVSFFSSLSRFNDTLTCSDFISPLFSFFISENKEMMKSVSGTITDLFQQY